MGKSATTTITKIKKDDDDADAELEAADELPLFGDLDKKTKKIDRVDVRRTDPDSGFLGKMTPNLTEAMISAKWGGGDYRLEGKNQAGLLVKVRTCKIAGDPLFASEAEEKRWRRLNGLEPSGRGGAGGDVKDLLVLMEERDEKRRTEQLEREERARKDAVDREERDRKLREDRDLQLRRDVEEREERRRREAREDDERRTRAHREDMERVTAANAAALAQAQQFFTQLATTMKTEAKAAGESDPVKTLIAGMQIAREMSGAGGEGGPTDFLTALVSRLPETLSEVRKTAAGAYAELTGKGGARGGKKADELVIRGATATKAKRVLLKLKAAGKDPEAEIGKILDFAEHAIAAPPRAAGAAPATTAPSTKTPAKIRAGLARAAARVAKGRRRGAPRRVAPRRGAA